MNNSIIHCGNEFEFLATCGTYFEVHRPFDDLILQEKKVETLYTNNIVFDFIPSKLLCAGQYELWLVFRTRIGNILKYIKPFFVEYPGCSCLYKHFLNCT